MIYYSDMDEDIRTIEIETSKLGYYFDSPKEISDLWKEFSDDFFAQWFVVNNTSIRHFVDWLDDHKEILEI